MSALAQPLISIVVATYHRPQVLRYAILSAQRQSVTDWEMIVVGDHCTDDTAEVVAGFAATDPRIRFVNLPVNHGEQSGPNNAGVNLARGRYIAFLNHDDLWFPDHLERAKQGLEALGADLVFTLVSVHGGDGTSNLAVVTRDENFDWATQAPASAWLFRRELVEGVGVWRHASECRMVPSHDWLYRAFEAGKRLKRVPWLTVIAISSGCRANSYRDQAEAGAAEEHRQWWERMICDPAVREAELTRLLLPLAWKAGSGNMAVWPLLTRAAKNAVLRVVAALGASPTRVRVWWNNRRGAIVNRLRRVRGLPPLPPKPR